MKYRQKLYSGYVSHHTSQVYGEVNLKSIKKQFYIWNKLYGKFLLKDKGIKILDAGCGDGRFLLWLQQKGFKDSFGVDVSKEQVKIAKNFGVRNIEEQDIFEYLKNKKGFFDLIFARDLIEHFTKEEVLELLGLFYASLSDKGKVVIQTVNAESPFFGRLKYGDFTHEIAFTKNSLLQVLTSVGFKKIKFYPTEPVIHGMKSMIRYLLWKIIEAKIRIYMLVETGTPKGIFTQNIILEAMK